MNINQLPVGVFDSGVGGLTVAREIFRNLPNEKIIYYGDTARVPYGNKSRDTIIRYASQITRFLLQKQVKAIVIACNTASALALDAVQAMTDIPVIGVVKPGADAAVRTTRTGRIGIIGTTGTITSGLYDRYIREQLPDAKVFGKACPLFVHLVEEGMIDDSVTIEMIHRYLDDMIQKDNIDTLVLGCTHYPLLRSVIAREIGGSYAGSPEEKLKVPSRKIGAHSPGNGPREARRRGFPRPKGSPAGSPAAAFPDSFSKRFCRPELEGSARLQAPKASCYKKSGSVPGAAAGCPLPSAVPPVGSSAFGSRPP